MNNQTTKGKSGNYTIAHELLDYEKTAFAVETSIETKSDYDARFKFIDKLISEADQTLKDKNINRIKARKDSREAEKVFGAIEEVLVKNNLLLHIRTRVLTETLTPSSPRPQAHFTAARRDHFQNHANEFFYHFDCDLGSYLILAIGEALSLPISLVEVPEHNFVRWNFEGGAFLNWDTNTARTHSNDEYRRGESKTAGTSFDKETERRRGFLNNLSKDEIRGYHLALIALHLKNNNHLDLARKYYKRGAKLRPRGTLAQNNLSWMYVTESQFNQAKYLREALSLSLAVDQIDPNDEEYKDTLACAYAANRKFKRAIAAEKAAHNIQGKIDGFKAGKTCLDLINEGVMKP